MDTIFRRSAYLPNVSPTKNYLFWNCEFNKGKWNAFGTLEIKLCGSRQFPVVTHWLEPHVSMARTGIGPASRVPDSCSGLHSNPTHVHKFLTLITRWSRQDCVKGQRTFIPIARKMNQGLWATTAIWRTDYYLCNKSMIICFGPYFNIRSITISSLTMRNSFHKWTICTCTLPGRHRCWWSARVCRKSKSSPEMLLKRMAGGIKASLCCKEPVEDESLIDISRGEDSSFQDSCWTRLHRQTFLQTQLK